LAARKSACWSSRTLSTGLLGLAAMPSHLPPSTRATKAGPLPSAGVVATGIDGTTNPSDSLPARLPFALGLWSPPSPDTGRWVGPLLFRAELSSHALLSTPGKSCAAPDSDAVCCLRRDMIGSAFPPFGSLLSRGCKVHPFGLGLRLCSPCPRHTPSTRALDAPLGRRDLSRRLEPATRRFGAYRGGTRTRKFDTASPHLG
jgi:hypothetical protein